MENLSISEKRKKKLMEEKNEVVTSSQDNILDVSELIVKCDVLIAEAVTLYSSSSNKELNDAIIILHSAKRSLNKISLN